MSGVRQAAAILYGLHHSDRDAILARLPGDQQAALRSGLSELAELGFAPTIGAGLMRSDAPPPPPASEPSCAAPAQMSEVQAKLELDGAAAARMLDLLADEPATLLADVLRVSGWSWTTAFLAGLPAARRNEVERLLAVPAPAAPARQRWLLDTLLARHRRAGVPDSRAPIVPPLETRRRWWQWRA